MFFNKKWCLAIAVFYCGIMEVQGQSGGGSDDFFLSLPKVMHPSPEAMAFMRYGEIPVSLSTGVPEISIPIYTIKANGLEIPISISYHASGIKVRDIPTVVGLGWVLNAGGMITQTVYSWGDNTNVSNHKLDQLFFSSETDARQQLSTAYWANIHPNNPFYGTLGYIDMRWEGCRVGYQTSENPLLPYYSDTYKTISDRFYFTINGRSGVFRYNLTTKKYETIPYSSLIIKTTSNGFSITDENGLIWEFNKQTGTENLTVRPKLVSAKEYYLTAIRFPGINDPVTFYYSEGLSYNINNWLESVFSGVTVSYRYRTILGHVEVDESYDTPRTNQKQYTLQTSQSTPLHLDSIRWRDLHVGFTYKNNNPSDLMKERLKTISVKWAGKEIRKAQLGPESRRFLDTIKINDEVYTFQYKSWPGVSPNHPYECTEDFWGYYNGSSHGQVPFSWQGSYPVYTRTYHNFREANPSYSQGGVLTTITYPTKGKTVFDYEQNRGYNVFNNMKANQPEVDYFGGLRVKKITNYDNSGHTSWKMYEYEGGPTVTITPEHFCATKDYYYLPVYNTIAVNYKEDIRLVTIGSLSTDYPFTEFGAQPAFYHKVTEYFGSTANEGKIEYNFIRDDSYANKCHSAFSYLHSCDKGMISPLLASKKEYAYKQGRYMLRKDIQNSYFKKVKGDFITGIDVKHKYEFVPELRYIMLMNTCPARLYDNYYGRLYTNNDGYFRFYNIYGLRDVMLLDSTITTNYSENGQAITTTTTYQYDDRLRVQTPVETSIFTNTDIIKEKVKHPFHYTTMPYTAMTYSNIYAPVIAKEKYVNGTLVATIKNDYRIDGNKFVKDSIRIAKGSEPLESRIKYHEYDSYGNPLHISKDNRQHVSYLWGYKGAYPVAEIRNATYNQVKIGLSGTLPESLSSAATPNMALIDNLRNHSGLDASLVNTAQFSPLEGISAAFDPNKIKTSYDYDRGILTTIKNNENKILQKYDYQFATIATDFQPDETPLSASIHGTIYMFPLTLQVISAGGSGKYVYSWYYLDKDYNLIDSRLYSSSNVYIVQERPIGNATITCRVTDIDTGREVETSAIISGGIPEFIFDP